MAPFIEVHYQNTNPARLIIFPVDDIMQLEATEPTGNIGCYIVLKHNPTYKYDVDESYNVVRKMLGFQ